MNKSILQLAIPNIVSNITVPLLGLVSMYIVGHLDSEDYIGAIALATMLFNFIYWSFSFLRMGTSGFTAQAFGARDHNEQANTLLRSLSVAMAAGVLFILFQYFIASAGFHLLNAEPAVKTYAYEYFYIYIWAAPAVLGMYTFNGWFIGMQDAKNPMLIAITVNIVNIVLSFTFVYGFDLKIKGIALATICAQYISFFLFIFVWNKKYGWLKKHFNFEMLKDLKSFIPFFKVNSDIFIRTMAVIAVTTFFMSASSKLGKDILAANALLMQMFVLFSYMMDGFAYAAEALTGKYIGEDNRLELKQLIKRLFMWGITIAALFTLIYATSLDYILSLLTDKENILKVSKNYQILICLIPIASFTAFLWDGIFVGATASHQMRNSMLIAVSIFFSIYFVFSHLSANNVLWMAFIVYLASRGIIQSIMARSVLNDSR